MSIDNSRISGTRFMFAIAFYLQASALLTSFLAGITEQESWIPLVLGFVLCLPLIYLYRTLMLMFPDENYLQVLCKAFGTIAGKVIGVFYLWFFLTVTALNVRDLGAFIHRSVLPETPNVIPTLCCVLVAAWAVRNGFKVVARYSSIFTAIEFIIVAVSIILVSNQIKLANFSPLFARPIGEYVQATHIIAAIPIGELVIFLMVMPCVRKLSRREATKYWFSGAAMGVIALLAVLLRDIAILGNALPLFTLPGLVTLRLVNLSEALGRTEIIFTVAIMMLLFFKITILIYVSTIAVAQLFETTHYKRLALIVSALVLAYEPTLYPSSVEHTISARTIEPVVWTLFEMILPLVTLIIAKLRRLPASAATGKREGSPTWHGFW